MGQCKGNCTSADQGVCTASKTTLGAFFCQCEKGFAGQACERNVTCYLPDLDELIACNGHGKCEAGKCVCDDGFVGFDCSGQPCPQSPGPDGSMVSCNAPHGQCDFTSGECTCEPGYEGDGCAKKLICENDCSGHGTCANEGQCSCADGWSGSSCDEAECPASATGVCGGHGKCDSGKCTCEAGFFGNACEDTCRGFPPCGGQAGQGICALNAAGHRACLCAPGFTGLSCEKFAECPTFQRRPCAGHGTCSTGRCAVMWTGKDCSVQETCPKTAKGVCNGVGVCGSTATCSCPPGWEGDACESVMTCAGNCAGHGMCLASTCYCDPGFEGEDRSVAKTGLCPRGCSGRGLCRFGKCVCEPGFTGELCEKLDDLIAPLVPGCGKACFGHGRCNLGRCICDPGWRGVDFDQPAKAACPRACSGHGMCKFSTCFCTPGFTGDDCSKAATCGGALPSPTLTSEVIPRGHTPPANSSRLVDGFCSGHGVCQYGKCYCEPHYQGEICDKKYKCPMDCSSRGPCIRGKCMCIAGFGGSDCSQLTQGTVVCPDSCNGHGVCKLGKCFCHPGFNGQACTRSVPLTCPNDCFHKGLCHYGKCKCFPGYQGEDCGTVEMCPSGCQSNGVCKYGRCFCRPGFGGGNCSVPLLTLSSKDSLLPAGGRTLCKNACSMRGICYEGICVCEPGYDGDACERVIIGSEQCPHDCRGAPHDGPPNSSPHGPSRGICVMGRCFCYPGYEGQCGRSVAERFAA